MRAFCPPPQSPCEGQRKHSTLTNSLLVQFVHDQHNIIDSVLPLYKNIVRGQCLICVYTEHVILETNTILYYCCFNCTIQTAVLSMMYITALSFGLVTAGIIIRQDDRDVNTNVSLFFAGGFIAAVGWVS